MPWIEEEDEQRPHVAWQTQSYGADGRGMNPRFMGQVDQLADLFYQAYGKPLSITSGYRPTWRQAQLYYEPHTRPVARPGHSSHERGEAIDIAESQVPLINRLPLNQLGLTTLSNINDPIHIQPIRGGAPMAPRQSQGYWVEEDEPQAKSWSVKASEVPGLAEAATKKPAQPQATMPEAPGIMAMLQRWRNRPLPTPDEKEKAINEMADRPGWQRRLLFTAIRNIKGFNPGGILREKGIEELEDVLQKAEQKATGTGYSMVSQAIPWAAGAAPLWEAGAGVAQSALRNIPKVGTIARAAEELPGIFKRGVGILPKVKGAAARAVTGSVTIPAMDVARGKMPGPWDVAMGAGFGAALGPGAFRLRVPPPRPGTAAASEEVSQQYKNVEDEVAAAFGGKAETAAPTTMAPTVEPKPSFTFDPGFTGPPREPMKLWYPQPGTVEEGSTPAKSVLPPGRSPWKPFNPPPPGSPSMTFESGLEPPRQPTKLWYPLGQGGSTVVPGDTASVTNKPWVGKVSPEELSRNIEPPVGELPGIIPPKTILKELKKGVEKQKKLKKIKKDISLGIRGVDPGTMQVMDMIDRLRSMV